MMNENLKTQKSNLAKLMASENITVQHKKIPTAYFDVQNRILACPTFKDDISPELYDLFMGHEVGHALHTPFEGLHSTLKENRTLKGYLNVVEDVRIERKIREKFTGLRKSFFKAYDELMQKDFFGIKDRDLQTLSLIDKINLITKVGSRVNIKLTDEEAVFLKAAEDCETWEDVVQVATAIYEWSKENETRDETDEAITNMHIDMNDEDFDGEDEYGDEESWSGSEDETDQDDYNEEESDEEGTQDGDSLPDLDGDEELEEETEKPTGTKGGKGGKFDPTDGAKEALTEHFAHNNEDQFIDENAVIKTYLKFDEKFKGVADNIIYSYKDVLGDWRKFLNKELLNKEDYYAIRQTKNIDALVNITPNLRQFFKNKNKSIINHMAKEFEMRQTAQKAVKAQIAKSGELDMNRLAKYQIVDDVFKRVTYLPEGKNHGVNVLVDWSGSISSEIKDILEQAVILSEFCRKVQIPFNVFLFSDCGPMKGDSDSWRGEPQLLQMLSNEMTSREYQEGLNIIYYLYLNFMIRKVGYCYGDNKPKGAEEVEAMTGMEYYDIENAMWTYDFGPKGYDLGGTPLDHCIVGLRKILPEFNKKYNIEKSILTVITDGFSHSADCLYESEEERNDFNSQLGDSDKWYTKKDRYLIDPYNKKPYILSKSADHYDRASFAITQNLLEWISNTCDVTITGYFVFTKKYDFRNTMYHILNDNERYAFDYDKTWREIRKEGKMINCKGYNKMFLVSATGLNASSDDGLSDDLIDAKKSRIMAAFKKNQRSKKTSRFLTNEFIKEIA